MKKQEAVGHEPLSDDVSGPGHLTFSPILRMVKWVMV